MSDDSLSVADEEPNGAWSDTVAEMVSGCGLSGRPQASCGPWIVVWRFLMRTVAGAGRHVRAMARVWTSGVVMMLGRLSVDETSAAEAAGWFA